MTQLQCSIILFSSKIMTLQSWKGVIKGLFKEYELKNCAPLTPIL